MTAVLALNRPQGSSSATANAIATARHAQPHWAKRRIRERIEVLRKVRTQIAENPEPLVNAVRACRSGSSEAEILVSEILPFLDALKFAERTAERILRPRKWGASARPFWLSGVELEIRREPFGVVLVIGPSNYPLFLAGVHAIQALVAGNAVLVKPGAEGAPAMQLLAHIAKTAGMPDGVFTILSENPTDALKAIQTGVDKVVLTGSATTGWTILKLAAESLTPVICELSGCDAVIVLPGADMQLVAKALGFGLALNQSRTCMRPHRVIVHQSLRAELTSKVCTTLSEVRVRLDPRSAIQVWKLMRDSLREGSKLTAGGFLDDQTVTPLVFENVLTDSQLWSADISAPVLAFAVYETEDEAIRLHNECPYGLTAAIFGPEKCARAMASKVDAGTVLVNDLIVPTADPRLPFSGRKQSGFGTTRGAEGILEFTRPKAITIRRSAHRHLESAHPKDAVLFRAAIKTAHAGNLLQRLQGVVGVVKAATARNSQNPNWSRLSE